MDDYDGRVSTALMEVFTLVGSPADQQPVTLTTLSPGHTQMEYKNYHEKYNNAKGGNYDTAATGNN